MFHLTLMIQNHVYSSPAKIFKPLPWRQNCEETLSHSDFSIENNNIFINKINTKF